MKQRSATPGQYTSGRMLVAWFSLACAAVTVLWLLQRFWQAHRETNWRSAAGVVEQVKPRAVTQVAGERGSAVLYAAAVLVRYSDDTGMASRWVNVRQTPRSLAEVQLEAQHWTGARCVVRWNPVNPEQTDIDLN